jgi:hypothetical protein
MEIPTAFSYGGSIYSPSAALCGEFSHLVDARSVLWGFHVGSLSAYNPALPKAATWLNCENVLVEEDQIFFLFGGATLETAESDCASLLNAIGFQNPKNDYILAIPEIPRKSAQLWTSIGFTLQSPEDRDCPRAVR